GLPDLRANAEEHQQDISQHAHGLHLEYTNVERLIESTANMAWQVMDSARVGSRLVWPTPKPCYASAGVLLAPASRAIAETGETGPRALCRTTMRWPSANCS